jgi:hypothetical protein
MNKLMFASFVVVSVFAAGCKKKNAGGDALAKMEGFSKSMCECKDKACADKVNDEMAKWGAEMSKTADKDAKPDPEMAKKSADVMTKYTECMTKLMMAGAGMGSDKPAGSDAPAGSDKPAGSDAGSAAGSGSGSAAGSAAAVEPGPCEVKLVKLADNGDVVYTIKNVGKKPWTMCDVRAFAYDKGGKFLGRGGISDNVTLAPGKEKQGSLTVKDDKDKPVTGDGVQYEAMPSWVVYQDKTEWKDSVTKFYDKTTPSGALVTLKK